MLPLKNILVATDFSECSVRAVEQAFALAAKVGARVHLVHVISAPLHELWAGYVPADDYVGVLNRYKADARRHLAALAAAYEPADCDTQLATPYGVAVDEILEYARAHRIDLIVCGTHGRRGIERLVMGSVAERIVQTAPCAVLTISPRGAAAAA